MTECFAGILARFEPVRDDTGEIVRWYGISTDIDALKQAEEKLREDERALRRITDAIPQTIVILDLEGIPIYARRPGSGPREAVIEAALADSRGRVSGPSGAAAKLGIPRQTLESKMVSLGIDRHRFRSPGTCIVVLGRRLVTPRTAAECQRFADSSANAEVRHGITAWSSKNSVSYSRYLACSLPAKVDA